MTIFNLTNTDWREAQFADTPCTRNAIQSRDPNAACYSKPVKNAVDPPEQITFTPGVPIGLRGGLTIYF